MNMKVTVCILVIGFFVGLVKQHKAIQEQCFELCMCFYSTELRIGNLDFCSNIENDDFIKIVCYRLYIPIVNQY